MENMKIYNAARSVPESAKSTISAGRLKGKTDINPMWRIKALTELFGPCGFGWKYIIRREWTEPGANGEIAAFVDIDLFVKSEGEWSEAIPGTGGSAFVAAETKWLYTSDECYKMALTDAISVACKALGFGADVYWDKDKTKYDQVPAQEPEYCCIDCGKPFEAFELNGKKYTVKDAYMNAQKKRGAPLCKACFGKMQEVADENAV